jgi:HSP20 family protein
MAGKTAGRKIMNELSLLDSIFGNDGFSLPSYRASFCAPKVDVIQNNSSYVLYMDLPGKTENDVEITLKNDVLTIASVDKKEKDCKDENVYILRERNAGCEKFKRSFTLPKDIDSGKVTASFKNGVLSVEIGRKEDSAEKKILISA